MEMAIGTWGKHLYDDAVVGPINHKRFLQGRWFYMLKLHDGWYTDEDGTRHHNSALIKFSDWISEDALVEYKSDRQMEILVDGKPMTV